MDGVWAEVNWALFLAASAAVILAPGQDLVLVLTRGAAGGRRIGVATAFGVGAGLVGHTLLAALGLGALIAASATAFTLLKWVGAAYLAFLGVRMILTARAAAAEMRGDGPPPSARDAFWQGAVSNIANPKIAVFFFAYLPQFAPADADGATAAAIVAALGAAFAALTVLIKAPIGWFAGVAFARLRAASSAFAWLTRIGGGALIALAAALAVEGRAPAR